MKSPVSADPPGIPAEIYALNSIAVACSTADRDISKVAPGASAAQQKAFLRETIFFHHFMAMVAVFYVFHQDSGFRSAYWGRIIASVNSGAPLPHNEELGLPPFIHFSAKDREGAMKGCFLRTGGILAGLEQELYLGKKPSESDLKVMNLYSVRETTGWDSPSANASQYFAAAFLARLCGALEIDPRERLFDLMRLTLYALAESTAAFKLYTGVLGAGA
jgi:hypothetical protein